MELDEINLTAEEAMDKAIDYLKNELRGVRTGRASTGLVEYVKVDYYGSPTDLRQLAIISVPEPTQIVIKPFDATSSGEIVRALEKSGLGLNPVAEGKQIRLQLPSLTGERRKQLINTVKQMGEQSKVTMRNARRDANKEIDKLAKDKSNPTSEDEIDATKEEIQDLLKKYEKQVDELIEGKVHEIEDI